MTIELTQEEIHIIVKLLHDKQLTAQLSITEQTLYTLLATLLGSEQH